MTHSNLLKEETPGKSPWVWSGFDAIGLLVAAFLAIVVEGFITASTPLSVLETGTSIIIVVIMILLLTRTFWKPQRVNVSQAVYQGASWAIGLLTGIGVKLVLAMSWQAGGISVALLLVIVTWAVRQQRFARRRLSQQSDVTIVAESRRNASESWFRREDLIHFRWPWLIFEAVFGGIVGFAAWGLILLYVVLSYTPLIPLFVPGVSAMTALLAGVGASRNRILRYVAARGFKTAFYFRSASFGFYIAAVVSGALGLGYYYGYVLPRNTELVLPFAGLFALFIYLHLLWARILVRSEEGRLCIFQFLVENNEAGGGYSWLKRGLREVEIRLQSFGVSVKRNRLYFGSSYSLFEGSDVETDLDKLYLLGDWSSQPRELRAVHDIMSWFVSRTSIAIVEGFTGAVSARDNILEIPGTLPRNLAGAIGFTATLVTVILGIIELMQHLGLFH